jgi:uncharacterized protein
VKEIGDLQAGMTLEGVVTNVTKFGAFVDVGVHQDGLVHISELADRYVKEPSDVVKVGQIVKVHVLSADAKTQRIALSMKTPGSAPKKPAMVLNKPASLLNKPASLFNKPASLLNKPASPAPKPPSLDDKLAALADRWKKR